MVSARAARSIGRNTHFSLSGGQAAQPVATALRGDAFPFGILTCWKSSFLATISEGALRVCQEAIARQPLPGCNLDVEPKGKAIARVAPDATAFADRDAASMLLVTSGWRDPRESETRIAWVRGPALRQGLTLRQRPGPGRRVPHGSGLRPQRPAPG